MGIEQGFESMKVLSIDHNVGRFFASANDLADGTKPWEYRFAELAHHNEIDDMDVPAIGCLIEGTDGGRLASDPLNEVQETVVLTSNPNFASALDPVMGQLNRLWLVGLEDEAE